MSRINKMPIKVCQLDYMNKQLATSNMKPTTHKKRAPTYVSTLFFCINKFLYAGGVPSAFEIIASICTNAFIGISLTPIVVLAGRSPLKNVG